MLGNWPSAAVAFDQVLINTPARLTSGSEPSNLPDAVDQKQQNQR